MKRSALRCSMFLVLLVARTSNRRSAPRSAKAEATWLPTNPVAPVTKANMEILKVRGKARPFQGPGARSRHHNRPNHDRGSYRLNLVLLHHQLLVRCQRDQREVLTIQVVHEVEDARESRAGVPGLIPGAVFFLHLQQIRDT